MKEKPEKEKLSKFNAEVFSTMPDEPYLGPVPSFGGGRRKTPALDWCFRAAAVILAGLFCWSLFRPEPPVDPVVFTAKAADVYTVANGVRSRVILPDSSVIWLNCGSELLVAEDFEDGNREVSLRGEGYFDVHSDPSNPFYVRTPGGPTVKVTGTVFNLSCYSPDEELKLTLLEGSVEVLTDKEEVFTLEEGSKITVKSESAYTDSTPDIDGDTAWKNGVLHFDNTPMKEVLESLERWYGVEITVSDISIYKNSFTADFRSESINQVLELMAIACDIVYSVDGNSVTIG
ncbi:sigma factor regulatory protein FecR/PupR family [Alistipes sp. CAG:831]|nr:sigma factor regulatory protein FecR/PupR family [Alistipes sp. CAG:831]